MSLNETTAPTEKPFLEELLPRVYRSPVGGVNFRLYKTATAGLDWLYAASSLSF